MMMEIMPETRRSGMAIRRLGEAEIDSLARTRLRTTRIPPIKSSVIPFIRMRYGFQLRGEKAVSATRGQNRKARHPCLPICVAVGINAIHVTLGLSGECWRTADSVQ